MDSREAKNKLKNFSAIYLKWLRDWLSFKLKLAVGLLALVVLYVSLPNSWQEGIGVAAKKSAVYISSIIKDSFDYIGSIAEEFSNFMSSVFTDERMTKFSNTKHRVMAIALIGGVAGCFVSLVLGVVFAALAVTLKIEKRDRRLRQTFKVLYILSFLGVTYLVVASQPAMAVVDKITRFLAH